MSNRDRLAKAKRRAAHAPSSAPTPEASASYIARSALGMHATTRTTTTTTTTTTKRNHG